MRRTQIAALSPSEDEEDDTNPSPSGGGGIGSGDRAVDQEWLAFNDQLPEDLQGKLFEHQKAGVRWLYGLHYHPSGGGVLGDDMGLGV
jgi:SNF2 family DNA or RNA helicase